MLGTAINRKCSFCRFCISVFMRRWKYE